MTDPEKDTQRSIAAAKAILDGRHPQDDLGGVMLTLEQTVATVLLMTMGGDRSKAAAMMNIGLTEGVERRLINTSGN